MTAFNINQTRRPFPFPLLDCHGGVRACLVVLLIPVQQSIKRLCTSVTVLWPLILQTAGRCYCRSEKERREMLLLILLGYYWTNKTTYSRLLTQIFLQIINFQRAGGVSSCHFLFMYYLDAREPLPGIHRPDK